MNSDHEGILARSVISPRLQTSLEAQAIHEGLLARSDYALGELYEIPTDYGRAGFDRRVLTYICLFPSISLTQSDFGLSRIMAASGLKAELIEPRTIRQQNICVAAGLMGRDEFQSLMDLSHDQAVEICKSQRADLIAMIEGFVALSPTLDFFSHLREQGTRGFQIHGPFAPIRPNLAIDPRHVRQLCRKSFLRTVEFLAEWYKRDHAATPFQGLGFEEALANKWGFRAALLDDPYFEAWLDKVDDFYVRLASALFWSNFKAEKLSVGQWWQPRKSNLQTRPEAAFEASQVLVQFKEELRVVPLPETIAEAVEMGRSNEMVRIRELIDRWLEIVGPDSGRLEQTIRKDIAKASAELRRLRRYKEFQESPIVFGMKLVAGQIPIVSNVVTVIEATGWLYERWASKRNCWVAIK